ncbi:flavodoxin family protein [Methanolobus sp. ZRKC3]|uniref:flavodoxin family protein n=1 Tax=Methanolobus sp. ZRKC3 TaxID=3125786 RepID=UPI0032527002
MKVIAINGSPRKEGNTAALLKELTSKLEAEGIETETINIGGKKVRGCTACMKCFENKNSKCVFDDDIINECIMKMKEADGIVIGSPTYFADVNTETKALIDRAGFVSIANDSFFSRKAGAAVVAVRRAGAVHAYDSINHLFGITNMVTVGSTYWNLGIGLNPGDVNDDAEGMQTMDNLASNMAWLLKKIHSE